MLNQLRNGQAGQLREFKNVQREFCDILFKEAAVTLSILAIIE